MTKKYDRNCEIVMVKKNAINVKFNINIMWGIFEFLFLFCEATFTTKALFLNKWNLVLRCLYSIWGHAHDFGKYWKHVIERIEVFYKGTNKTYNENI